MNETNQTAAQRYAKAEYQRLTALYREAGVEELRLSINDSLLHKVAELYGILEAMRGLPTICYDKKHRASQRETAVGRARVRYMAQYAAAMQRLNRELLGSLGGEDEGLADYE